MVVAMAAIYTIADASLAIKFWWAPPGARMIHWKERALRRLFVPKKSPYIGLLNARVRTGAWHY